MGHTILDDEAIILRAPELSQKKVLDKFRLTEVFRDVYGNYMLDHLPNGKAVQDAIEAVKTFKGVDEVDIRQWKDLLIDLMYSYYVLGFKAWEYFVYDFDKKTIPERLEFMPQRNIRTYRMALKTNPASAAILINKYKTYQKLKPYYKRDVFNFSKTCSREKFFDFCRSHSRFIAKPVGLQLGQGIRIVNCEEYQSLDEVYDTLMADENAFVCEELIVCDDVLSAFHPESVNSVRVFTYVKTNGEPTIVCSWLRVGTGDAFIDNGSTRVLAAIDENTGVIYTDAANDRNQVFPAHPDTGVVFKGTQIPRWQELREMVLEIATLFPGIAMIGWDVTLSKDRGWQVIEGNGSGMVNLIQLSTRKGWRRELEKRFEWDINRKKLPKS